MIELFKNEKTLAAAAYLFGVPALYIILTDLRNNKYLSFHAAQAGLLWLSWIVAIVVVRILFSLIWLLFYAWPLDPLAFLVNLVIWGYIAFCGYRVYKGIDFEVPYITKIALAIW
ncbi:MAG: hypothetical protein NT099_02705 [Candidatus Saganbacteria bacterium]|nr:hypothetical protein [Candidatus Saganbacteria bacterium]